jgi:hypothetical protein
MQGWFHVLGTDFNHFIMEENAQDRRRASQWAWMLDVEPWAFVS